MSHVRIAVLTVLMVTALSACEREPDNAPGTREKQFSNAPGVAAPKGGASTSAAPEPRSASPAPPTASSGAPSTASGNAAAESKSPAPTTPAGGTSVQESSAHGSTKTTEDKGAQK